MEWIIPVIIIVILLIIIIRNIAVVQQSRAYVIERLGAFKNNNTFYTAFFCF